MDFNISGTLKCVPENDFKSAGGVHFRFFLKTCGRSLAAVPYEFGMAIPFNLDSM